MKKNQVNRESAFNNGQWANTCGLMKRAGQEQPTPQPGFGSSGSSGSLQPGKTTRYWDCCKPSCSWPGKADVSAPVKACQRDGRNAINDFNARNGCESGGTSYAFNDNQPWSVNKNLAYGFAAAALTGQNERDWCCACTCRPGDWPRRNGCIRWWSRISIHIRYPVFLPLLNRYLENRTLSPTIDRFLRAIGWPGFEKSSIQEKSIKYTFRIYLKKKYSFLNASKQEMNMQIVYFTFANVLCFYAFWLLQDRSGFLSVLDHLRVKFPCLVILRPFMYFHLVR